MSLFGVNKSCYFCAFRYIRVVGTHNTVNKVFHLVALECMYTNRPFTLERGLLGNTVYCNFLWNYFRLQSIRFFFFLHGALALSPFLSDSFLIIFNLTDPECCNGSFAVTVARP